MSSFWSWWIIVLTLGSLVAIGLLLWWNMKNFTDVEEGESMGHEFDGIIELNNPLPTWWTVLFWICLAWGLLYLILYPGLGNFPGLFKWQSANQFVLSLDESRQAAIDSREAGLNIQYDAERRRADEVYGPIFQQYASMAIEEIAQDRDALRIGQRLFLQNCAQCHGSDARGAQGFPNLTDGVFNWGASAQQIHTTIMDGRQAAMPAFGEQLGERGIEEMTAYVLSLNGRIVDRELARAGEQNWMVCAACHGQDAKGNPALGAPNLTDNVFIYGATERAIAETLRYGRNGVMPAWKDILGEDKVKILSGYVLSLAE
ncbi:cytochrome-c oxidase, cbb3-type subunit III [Aliidiomarina haloalkalitolerans]|mgnify:FL=1|uniref:Cbb3-type cytochrome c oxidase subunit n=1 Tax=Aliidiomarina haloalkalitolerans TaxID=859059 RepID=A0A432VYA9_9GAMM|nr:cytochrome-c oxidase, cbb3-type subunit III [Aliidiomarina haloalkalitolerans]RUO21672.1 cytochrome-c oxidase, cbb3-type subunit III [Aliidiomarina haloalkalitolerans]